MKRILIQIILALALCSSCYAGSCADRMLLVGGAVSGGASCETTKASETGTVAGSIGNGNASRRWLATKFVAPSTGFTSCAAKLYLFKTGSPTMNLQACIYSDSGDLPAALVGTCSSVVTAASIDTSEVAVSFSSMAASITGDGTYWVVFKGDGYGDGTNYITWNYKDGGTTERVVSSADGVTWSVQSTTRGAKYEILGN